MDNIIPDTLDSPDAVPAVEGAVSAPVEDTDSGEAQAQLEKRLHDTQSKVSDMGNANAELKAQIATLQASQNIGTQIAEAMKGGGFSADEIAAEQARIKEEMNGENGVDATYDFIQTSHHDIKDDLGKRMESLESTLKNMVESKLGEVSTKLLTSSPEYLRNKEQIDTVAETFGVPLEKATAMVNLLIPSAPQADAAPSSPGTTGGGRHVGSSTEPAVTTEDMEAWSKAGVHFKPEELAALNKGDK